MYMMPEQNKIFNQKNKCKFIQIDKPIVHGAKGIRGAGVTIEDLQKITLSVKSTMHFKKVIGYVNTTNEKCFLDFYTHLLHFGVYKLSIPQILRNVCCI